MVFSSMTFVPLFLPLILILYYATRHSGIRNSVLLIFSLLFYAWGEPIYILLMLGSALLNFLFGEKVGVIILTPGESVENVEIKEIGGEA